MGNSSNKDINDSIKLILLKDFIKRMLIYYDPMELVASGAPHDEYDSDIDKIFNLIIQQNITLEELSSKILDTYKGDVEDIKSLERKAQRMAEDLLDLKNS